MRDQSWAFIDLDINSKEKTLILIVIRDHVGATPLENLAKTLQADLEKIWAGLSKVCFRMFVVANTDYCCSLKDLKIARSMIISTLCLLACHTRFCCLKSLMKK